MLERGLPRRARSWRDAGHPIGIAVNVSARQLDTDEFVADVERRCSRAAASTPSALTLEITETTLMRNAEETARRLRAIKELGVRIAIDDFGTGYSSLAHLQRFPVDALKIDRSFISQLAENPEGETLIRTLVQLGKALSIETLAEGIEQRARAGAAAEEQCDSGQGFLFARPLEVDAAEAFLRDWRKNDTPDVPLIARPGGHRCPTACRTAPRGRSRPHPRPPGPGRKKADEGIRTLDLRHGKATL